MFKKIMIIVISLLMLIVIILIYPTPEYKLKLISQITKFIIIPRKTELEFIYRAGGAWGHLTEVDTFTETLTIETPRGLLTLPITFTDNEFRDILAKIYEFNILDQEVLTYHHRGLMMDCPSYYLKIQIPTKTKEINWGCSVGANDNLVKFHDYLDQIIQNKEVYKKTNMELQGHE